MTLKIWGSSVEGTIVYVSLGPEYLKEALELLRQSVFINVPPSQILDLYNHKGALNELVKMCKIIAKDGLSIVAINKKENKVVGVALNSIRTSTKDSLWKTFSREFTERKSLDFLQVAVEFEKNSNIFDLLEVDAFLEVVFLAMPDYRCNGMTKKLYELSIYLANELNNDGKVKHPFDEGDLCPKLPPKAVVSLFRTRMSKYVGKEMGFCTAIQLDIDQFEFLTMNVENNYVEKDKSQSVVILAYKKLVG